MNGSVLLVDDDPTLRRALKDRLGHWGLAVEEAAGGEAALEAAKRREFDLVLLDLSMPGMNGMDVLRALRADGCPSDVVVLTAHGSVEAAVEALRLGASDFLQKPADFEIVRSVVDRALSRRRGERVAWALAERVGGGAPALLGASEAMRRLVTTATRAARSDATVLVTGESGSGKQVLAEFLHAESERRAGPFVYVNCVALSDELIESTLFGHEKGAFTGAVERKAGRLELAAGGTALLDEIGDTTPRLQTKLLHFLETGEYERVGGTKTLSVDCRIVAATNRDLEAMVREGRFREDLYYRLNVVHLAVPPLRRRREDVLPLAGAFLEGFARDLKRGPMRLAPRTAELLGAYAWPGNVRQLKNAVERMAVLAPGEVLTPDLLPPEVFAPPPSATDADDLPLHDAVLEFKKSHIARALAKTGGNQTKAADLLGLQRTHLSRLMRELGMRGAPADDPREAAGGAPACD